MATSLRVALALAALLQVCSALARSGVSLQAENISQQSGPTAPAEQLYVTSCAMWKDITVLIYILPQRECRCGVTSVIAMNSRHSVVHLHDACSIPNEIRTPNVSLFLLVRGCRIESACAVLS